MIQLYKHKILRGGKNLKTEKYEYIFKKINYKTYNLLYIYFTYLVGTYFYVSLIFMYLFKNVFETIFLAFPFIILKKIIEK